jgi:cell division septum initiation protein DivIVA
MYSKLPYSEEDVRRFALDCEELQNQIQIATEKFNRAWEALCESIHSRAKLAKREADAKRDAHAQAVRFAYASPVIAYPEPKDA